MNKATFAFTDDNFASATAKGLSLVDLYADWCGPCKIMAPTIDKLATQYEGRAKIGKLNVDNNPGVAQDLGVSSIPTVIFFKDGREINRFVGVQKEADLAKVIEGNL